MPVTVFGGGAVQTAYVSFTALDITANSITLVWPTSYFDVPSIVDGIHYNVLAASMTVNDGTGNTNTVTLPDATESSVGSNFIITNIGASAFQLLKSDSTELLSIPNTNTSNSFWVQLIDNSTSAGTWQFVQFGAGTSQAQASALAGNGLVPLLGLLNTNIAVKSIAGSPYNVIISDRAKLLLWQTGIGVVTLLPIATPVPAGFYISFNNEGTGVATISGDATIDNNASVPVAPGQSLTIISDGTKWWTLGFGQNLSSSNFAAGSAIAPSITFTPDTTTGLYYYQTNFPPVNPPGIGFSVNSSQIANITPSGLYMTAGKTIIVQDPTTVSQTVLSTNANFAQIAWQGTITNPATISLTGTNTDTTFSIGPFAGISIVESNTLATLAYNSNIILSISSTGVTTFPLPVIFSNTIVSNNTATFNNEVTLSGGLSTPLNIANGGTGQNTQQAALKALMPSGAVIGDIVYYDATNNWVRLPIGTINQVLTVQNISGNLVPRWV
jgi:hypothetical protein